MHYESPKVIEGLRGGEGAVSAFVSKNPMAREDAAHPKGVDIPPHGPRESVDAEERGGQISGEGSVCDEDAGCRHGCVAQDEVHGVEVGSIEAFFGDDGFDFSFGGEGGCRFREGVVGRDPVGAL